MVFKKEDKFVEFDNPKAFDKEDCLACRVLGKTATDNLESLPKINLLTSFPQARRHSWR